MSTLRGVVKAVLLKIGLGEEGVAADGILEKRKGWEIGSRRDGKGFLVGDSKAVWGPSLDVSLFERKEEEALTHVFSDFRAEYSAGRKGRLHPQEL